MESEGGVGDYLLTLAYQVLGAKEFNKLLPMPKLQTPQFAYLGLVLLYIGLHTVLLNFMQLYKCFQTLLLRLSG